MMDNMLPYNIGLK